MDNKYSKDYSEGNFWNKLKTQAKSIGKVPVENALKLFFSMKLKKATPTQITAIILALGYLICPIDAIPDLTPLIGYTDDAGVLAAAVAALACCADPAVTASAKSKLNEWFK